MGERATIDQDYLYGAADAIRRKNGTSNTYTPAQLEAAIDAIPTGINPTGTISITENGDHDVTNYATASVNVSGGGGESYMMLVTATSYYNDWCSPLMAFGDQASNWWGMGTSGNGVLTLKFDKPAIITEIGFSSTWISGTYHWSDSRVTFQCSDNGTTWTDLSDTTNLPDSMDTYTEARISNPTAHTYYRFVCYISGGYWAGLGRVKLTIDGISEGDDPFALTDYLESSGTQYIDTGYAPTQTSRYEVVANVPSSNSAWATLFGARDGRDTQYGNAVWYGVKYDGGNAIVYNWGFANTGYNQSLYFGRKTVFHMQNNGVCFQASDYLPVGITFTAGSTLTSSNLYLFSLNVSSGDYGSQTRCTMKLYRFRIYEGETLVHEFLPWLDGNDVACLKDTVTGNLKYNAGTGAFTYGTDV